MSIYFLSGLPRSGSTVLGAILGQHPDITVTPTSPFLDLLCYTNEALNKVNEQYTFDFEQTSRNVYQSLYQGFYKSFGTKHVIDKHRGHPRNVTPWRTLIGVEPKIICTTRPVAEVIASYLKLIDQQPNDNFVDSHLIQNRIPINTANRAKCLWDEYISDPYQSMVIGLKDHRECLHIVEYSQLVNAPNDVLKGIYRFLGLEGCNHDFSAIHNVCAEEKDAAWGIQHLHDIRPVLGKTSTPPEEILGPYLTDFYNQYTLTY